MVIKLFCLRTTNYQITSNNDAQTMFCFFVATTQLVLQVIYTRLFKFVERFSKILLSCLIINFKVVVVHCYSAQVVGSLRRCGMETISRQKILARVNHQILGALHDLHKQTSQAETTTVCLFTLLLNM